MIIRWLQRMNQRIEAWNTHSALKQHARLASARYKVDKMDGRPTLHDSIAHVTAGSYGAFAPGCPKCEDEGYQRLFQKPEE